jgi:hypothetical protein
MGLGRAYLDLHLGVAASANNRDEIEIGIESYGCFSIRGYLGL